MTNNAPGMPCKLSIPFKVPVHTSHLTLDRSTFFAGSLSNVPSSSMRKELSCISQDLWKQSRDWSSSHPSNDSHKMAYWWQQQAHGHGSMSLSFRTDK